MQTFKINKKVKNFDIDGTVYAIREPNIVEFNEYHAKLKANETKPVEEQDEISFELLNILGLPSTVSKTLVKADITRILGLVVYNVDTEEKTNAEKK